MIKKGKESWDDFRFDVMGTRLDMCWNCGCDPMTDRPHWWLTRFHLERAHIGAGSGRIMRLPDRRAAVLLCSFCHKLHVHRAPPTMFFNMEDYPTITDGMLIGIKKEMDPNYYSARFIRDMWLGKPPRAEKRPRYWQLQFDMRTRNDD